MAKSTPIAVVGMSCRMPGGVNSPEDLWDMLRDGRSGWGKIPAERWNAEALYHPDSGAKESLKFTTGYFLQEDVSRFDARFFGIVPYEAHTMDPQQRLVLETAYTALENAGIPVESLSGTDTAVFVGVFARDFDRMGYKDVSQVASQHITGAGDAVLSARVSYAFNLKGASMTIDTGCSASMSALHQAALTLKAGESRVAIVSGVELLLHPEQTMVMGSAGMSNPEGKCYVFDHRGSGYARGEGVGTLILKRLDHAIEDGDEVHAVILNSALNQDGKTPGITLPSSDAQAALMKEVHESAGVDPADTLYVEAHGTGTVAGDNAEISSIHRAFCMGKNRDVDLRVGSVKASIGHLEAASCMAGIIKTIMILKNGMIPPQIEFEKEKPGLKLTERNIKIPLSLIPLAPQGYDGPRRASVNSFGYGGTNGHVLLELSDEALRRHKSLNGAPYSSVRTTNCGTNGVNGDPNSVNGINGHFHGHGSAPSTKPFGNDQEHDQRDDNAPLHFPLTARSEAALNSMVRNTLKWLDSETSRPYSQLQSLSYTLRCRRSKFPWRRVAVASSVSALKIELSQASTTRAEAISDADSNLAFVFTGQGAQWYAMGRQLIEGSSAFRESIDRSEDILKNLGCIWSLREELSRPASESCIGQSHFSQPATTSIQVALVDMLARFGVRPSHVVGHSSGEIAAAYAAGIMTHQVAMETSFRRGLFSVMAREENEMKGSMLAVGAGPEAVASMIADANAFGTGKVQIGCINSPDSVTVSGDEPAIDKLKSLIEISGSTFVRKLRVDNAYHSHHMEVVAERYLRSLDGLHFLPPTRGIKFVSSVTGTVLKEGFTLPGSYWTTNLVSPVRFSDAVTALANDMRISGNTSGTRVVFVEIGPHCVLQGPLRQTLSGISDFKYNYTSCLVRDKDARSTFLASIGVLFQHGYNVDLGAIDEDTRGIKTQDRRLINDLKPYPFDHDTKYWRESRLSRNQRLRPFPYHDLLGLLDPYGNSIEPRWRYHLSTNSLPWLKHHKVDGAVVFPGAGYVSMAIEGMKQLQSLRAPKKLPVRYVVRNINFTKPIIILDDGADGYSSEIEVHLIISQSKTRHNSSWHKFQVLSYAEETSSWSEHCNGTIRVYTSMDISDSVQQPVDAVEGLREEDLMRAQATARLESIMQTSQDEVDVETFYKTLEASGNEYGSTFSSVTKVKTGRLEGYIKQAIPDVSRFMPGSGFVQKHVIHPSTLDTFSHLACLLYKRELRNSPLMLAHIGEISISADITSTPNDELVVATRLQAESKMSASGTAWVYQKNRRGSSDMILVCSVSDIQVRSMGEEVGEAKTGAEETFSPKYEVAWEQDVDFMSQDAFSELVTSISTKSSENGHANSLIMAQGQLTETAAAIITERFLSLPENEVFTSETAPHFAILYRWMKHFSSSEEYRTLLSSLDTSSKDAVLASISEVSIQGRMLARIQQNLLGIFTGKIEALQVMIRDDLLNRIYAEGPISMAYDRAARYLEVLSFKKPHMRILEIGAGTGGVTTSLLEALHKNGTSRLDTYHYTDVSTGFFAQAKEKFKDWKVSLEFKALDITEDPEEQGFKAHSYDLIVASNVLHATPSIEQTLQHTRKLLKSGGCLLLLELTRKTACVSTIFGVLPGWWASEDGRENSPLLTESEWQTELIKSGFSGIRHVAHDVEEFPTASLIISEAVEAPLQENGVSSHPTIKVIDRSDDKSTELLCHDITAAYDEKGFKASHLTWDTLVSQGFDNNGFSVILDNTENPILENLSPEQYEALKHLCATCSRILWVSMRQSDTVYAAASHGLVTGFARVVRRETEGLRFVTLNTAKPVISPRDLKSLVTAVLDLSVESFSSHLEMDDSTAKENDDEYVLAEGRLMIPRVQADVKLNNWEERKSPKAKAESCHYSNAGVPLKVQIETPGLLNTLRFVHDKSALEPLGADQIQIQALAYGVNFRDVFIALGQMPPHLPMAGEVCGVVTAVGSSPETQRRFKIGDRVAGMSMAPYASYPCLGALQAHKVPDSLSSAIAASVPVVYMTAYYCLVDVARLQKGQSILIHSASGGVGQAAILLAKHLGATQIFVTVGSAKKRDFVMSTYGIPESHVFSSRNEAQSFKQGIMRLTENRGVDVVLNSLAGEILAESWECLAEFGTHVEIGKTDIYKKSHLDMSTFDRNTTFASVDLLRLCRSKPEQMQVNLKKIFGLLETGALEPVQPITNLSIDRIEQAFRLFSDRKHIGKVVLEINPDVEVQAVPPPPPALEMKKQGTYIIAGGLGDLGKRLCRLLASRGAGHVVSLSRRILDDNTRTELEDSVAVFGASLHIERCDITDQDSVEAIARKCRAELPPVRGVIHGGMVLRDRPFENMSFEDFNVPLGPKVTGTINLDNAFCVDNNGPAPDFFITLSSLTSIRGSPGQANYSAGCAFQDAFVLAKKGRSCTQYTTLNIGAIEGSDSVLAMSGQQQEMWRRTTKYISFEEFYSAIEYAMSAGFVPAEGAVVDASQHIMGLDRACMMAAQDGFSQIRISTLFSTLPYPQKEAATKEAEHRGILDTEKVLINVRNLDEAVKHITEIMVNKFSIFLDRPASEIRLDQSLASLGMDSLISIEIKNWMVRKFRAAMQPTEVMGAATIPSLALTLATRSTLVPRAVKEQGSTQETVSVEASTSEQTSSRDPALQATKVCCKHANPMQRQPIPDLDEALSSLFQTGCLHARGPDEIKELKLAIEDFKKPQGPARQLHSKLARDAQNPEVDNWLRDQVAAEWLRRRDPIQRSSGAATHFDAETQHTQAERAAIIAAAAIRHKLTIDKGDVEVNLLGTSVCTDSLGSLFNTARAPKVGVDEVRKYSGEYFVVLRQGHFFCVPFTSSDGVLLSTGAIIQIMESILTQSLDNSWVGILTTDQRDSWAQKHEELLSIAQNGKSLPVVSAAAFIICLDSDAASTNSERVSTTTFGTGFNRWFDKGLQFVIASNGTSSWIFDHALLDGLSVRVLNDGVQAAINSFTPELRNSKNSLSVNHDLVEEVPITTSMALESHIKSLRTAYTDASSAREFRLHRMTKFAKNFLVQHNAPAKAIFAVLVQLATYLSLGHTLPSWEPVSLAHFHRGRIELIEYSSRAINEFCTAATSNETASIPKKRRLLFEAAKDNNERIRSGSQGQGFHRLLHVMHSLWPKSEPAAALYESTIWRRLIEFPVISMMSDGTVMGTAHWGERPDSLWIWTSYSISDYEAVFSIVGAKGGTARFAEHLDEAASIIKLLIEQCL